MSDGMRPHDVIKEQMNLKAFTFSLKEDAKDWLYFLPTDCMITWKEMKRQFLEIFFPILQAARIRKEIYGILQTGWDPALQVLVRQFS